MYGWINACFESLILAQYGEEVWRRIRQKTLLMLKKHHPIHQPHGIGSSASTMTPSTQCSMEEIITLMDSEQNVLFFRNKEYSDELTYVLLAAATELLLVKQEDLVEALGAYFVNYLTYYGYESTLRLQGSTFLGWLEHINEPHRLFRSRFPHSVFPRFEVTKDATHEGGSTTANGDSSMKHTTNLILSYSSTRGDIFHPLVVGIVRQSAKEFFGVSVNMTRISYEDHRKQTTPMAKKVKGRSFSRESSQERVETSSIVVPAPAPSNCPYENTAAGSQGLVHVAWRLTFDTESSMLSTHPLRAKAEGEAAGLKSLQTHDLTSIQAQKVSSEDSEHRDLDLDSSARSFASSSGSLAGSTDNGDITTESSSVIITTISQIQSKCPFSMSTLQNQYVESQAQCPIKHGPLHTNQPLSAPTASKSTFSGVGLSGKQLERVFPFHLVIDSQMRIVQCGRKLADYVFPLDRDTELSIANKALQGDVKSQRDIEERKEQCKKSRLLGYDVGELFQIIRPSGVEWNWPSLMALREETLAGSNGTDDEVEDEAEQMELEVELLFLKDRGKYSTSGGVDNIPNPNASVNTQTCFLGNMIFSQIHSNETERVNEGYIIFLLHPDIHNLEELVHRSLSLSDLPRHSAQCDVILMGEQLKQETCYGLSLDAAYKAAEREKKKVVSALNTKRVFVRYVSHEIRTPLNITLLGLQHLESMLDQIIDRTTSKYNTSTRSTASGSDDATQSTSSSSSSSMSVTSASELDNNPVNESICLNRMDRAFSNESLYNENNVLDQATTDEIVEEVLDTVEDVKASCRVAVDIVNDLLLFERLDNGIFYVAKSNVAVPAVLQRVVSLFTVQARSLGIDLQYLAPIKESSPEETANEDCIKVDISKFDQVLRNLVSNALKFTPAEKVKVEGEGDGDDNTAYAPTVVVSYEIIHQQDSATTGLLDSEEEDDDNDFDDETNENDELQRSSELSTASFNTKQTSPSKTNESSNTGTRKAKIVFVESFHDLPLPDELFSIQEEDCYSDRFVRIFVKDTGPGMTYEEQCRLFSEVNPKTGGRSNPSEQGVSSPANRGIQGSGLGLWIASIIIRLHGGRLGVTSEGKGKGTTFVIDIPLLLPTNKVHDNETAMENNKDSDVDRIPMIPVPESMKQTVIGQRYQAKQDEEEIAKRRRIEDQAQGDRMMARKSLQQSQEVTFVASAPLRASFNKNNSSATTPEKDKSVIAATENVNQEQFSPSRPLVPVTTTRVTNVVSSSRSSKIVRASTTVQPITVPTSIPMQISASDRDALLNKLKKQRLLIVDDTPLNRKIFRKVLRHLFLHIDEAENGLKAVDMFHEAMGQGTPYHVIMMDFLMPIMDGLEATKRIRQQSTYPVVIVGVTGNGWEADIDLFVSSGADHVLMKPLDIEKFLCVLSQAPWL